MRKLEDSWFCIFSFCRTLDIGFICIIQIEEGRAALAPPPEPAKQPPKSSPVSPRRSIVYPLSSSAYYYNAPTSPRSFHTSPRSPRTSPRSFRNSPTSTRSLSPISISSNGFRYMKKEIYRQKWLDRLKNKEVSKIFFLMIRKIYEFLS